MYRLVKFKKEHLEVMDIREHERVVLSQTNYADILEQDIAVTGIVEGKIVCCGGVGVMHGGNANIWLIPSIYLQDHAKTVVKGLREWLFGIREDFQLQRMQTICLDDELHDRWMKYLGFKRESVMKNYYNGESRVMYGRTEWD